MEESLKMLHTNLTKEEAAEYVFLPGSPQRVKKIAAFLDGSEYVKVNREYETWSGKLEGKRVLVVSTGMGGPSAVVAVEELSRLGAHTFIRIGTCATTCEKVRRGDVVIPTAAVRMEGTSNHYAPIEYPAVPDIQVLDALRDAASKEDFNTYCGVIITRDGFYTQSEAEQKPIGYEIAPKWNAFKKMGAIATEMECSPIFIAANSIGVRSGAVMACATDYLKYTGDSYKAPIEFESLAIKVAVEAMKKLIRMDMQK